MRKAVLLLSLAALLLPGLAHATPVAKNDSEYSAYGRVFPDPLAACSVVTGICSPNAQGRVPATQFIQWGEFVQGVEYLNSKPEWQRFLEVLVLDGKIGPGGGNLPGGHMFPGNDMDRLEWTPKDEYTSAGLPTTTVERQKNDLVVLRVTDESVPDKHKKRYVLSLSIHGIERAGVEGGTRAVEDLVTAATRQKIGNPILPFVEKFAEGPTYADVLRKSIIYFAYPNPDGWLRGSVTHGGVFFQRYNGNGVDLNRDWPDIGYAFRPYSAMSEPETRALAAFLGEVRKDGKFAAGDDLHGQPFADALSYTLLPHGRHDFGKDHRIRETAKSINQATYEAIKWSPVIQANDKPLGGGLPCAETLALGDACAQIYAQTWGTVYDTINYTTTGTLGDWFDSTAGLGADGIDNEMSYSHLDRNIVFDPHTEQLHVEGNKFLVYAHLAEILAPETATFAVPGAKAYVANERLTRAASQNQTTPKKSEPQPDIVGQTGVADPAEDGQTVFPFKVYSSSGKGRTARVHNGGMRVDITNTNVQGIATGLVTLKVQCRYCDHHVGTEDEDGWVTVAEDYNQSFVYAQAGLTAAINNPEASPEGVEWRAVTSAGSAVSRMDVHFTSGPATLDGNTGGDEPPAETAYDVANTDFFADLNKYIPAESGKFSTVDPLVVAAGTQSLDGLDTLVLADNPLPGYQGLYEGEPARPSGPPTEGFLFESQKATTPGLGERTEATVETRDFTIGPNDGNASVTVKMWWESGANDWDMYLYRLVDGEWVEVKYSAGPPPGTSETIEVPEPPAGDYRIEVVNYAAVEPGWKGSVSFTPFPAPGEGTVTEAQKDAWIAKLRTWVEAGGNLVLTDGALRALPELTSVPGDAVKKQTVYVGQVAFATGSGQDTLGDPLNADVAQPGARFNSGMRRQTFEPTPLGFAIQSPTGDDAAYARQYDVDKAAFEAAGGRVAATSANSGARNAQAVYSRVTVGEIPLGTGQIRIMGALLPQPSQQYDHQLGIEPYAVTYTGYILARNLLTP